MKRTHRKSTPKVKGGIVQKKNNDRPTPNYWNTAQKAVIIDVEKPGKGYKHFLKKKDIIKFLELIPNWGNLSKELDAIVLGMGNNDYDGYYNNGGVIVITAWEKEQDVLIDKHYFKEHQALLERLGITYEEKADGYWCEFTVEQIKAFQLLHILLHELGHHLDRITTKSKRYSSRGEQYAEDYAYLNESKIWIDYQDAFNIVF